MDNVAREFLRRLAAEEENFVRQSGLDEIGLGLLTAIKEFDFYYYNLVRNDADDESAHHFHIMQLGLPRLISAVLKSVARFKYPVVTFRSDKALILGALDQVAAFGFVEEGKRLGQAALAEECQVLQVSERQFDVVTPDIVFNMEQHEASVENHYARLQRERVDKAAEETFGKTGTLIHVDALLSDSVYVFGEHFIGYDAHPDLDDFFFGLALSELQNQTGYDTYNGRIKFGGVTVQKYTLATAFFLAIALRHERFAAALIKKSPHIRLRDILTVTAEKQELEDALIEALNKYGPSFEDYTTLTRDEAKTILRVLSARRDNIAILASTMAPLPFLIEFSESTWIKSLAGVQTGAMTFLLNSLRFNFPADYDRNQQAREGSMRRAVKELLADYAPRLSFVQNVRIQKDGKTVTDIDLAAIDETGGSVMLFQFKHQDHYGGDVRRRSSRATRLREEVDHWLAAIREWLNNVGPAQFASSLQRRATFRSNQTFLVVIAKHFAHFLSASDLRNDCAYATWMQFFDALVRIRNEERPRSLGELFATLQRFMSHQMARGYELQVIDNYHLLGLSYRIRPRSAGKT